MNFDRLHAAVNNGETANILTIINSSEDSFVGKMIIVYADGSAEGDLEIGFIKKVLAELNMTEWIKPEIIYSEYLGQTYRIFWDRVVQKKAAIVLGGGHISQPLVEILGLLDFLVTVIDDRPEFANEARFPSAQVVICSGFQKALKNITINSNTAVIIVTRGHRYDLECLRAVIASNAGYLGMIGSRKRIHEIFKIFEDEGGSYNLKNRLRAPIGLDIKAQTPAEIAVSIAAEVICCFGGGSGLPLSKG